MTNNTIPNVPRDLLERIAGKDGTDLDHDGHLARKELRTLLSAPSPAGVDGLDGVSERIAKVWIGHAHIDDLITIGKEVDAAQAIIDGLRSVIDKAWNRSHQLDRKAYIPGALDAWKRPVLQHLPYDFSGNPGASATQYCNGWNDAGGYWRAHADDLVVERDQQAQRIDELVEVLRIAGGAIKEICTERNVPLPSSTLRRIDAALSAGKEGR